MKHHDKNHRVTRRDFLRGTAYATLGLAMGIEGLPRAGKGSAFAAENPLSQVVLIRHEAAVDAGHQVNSVVVLEMLDTAMKTFTGESNVAKAWQRYFHPQDNVGIKYTRCSWQRIHVNQAVLDAITDPLIASGVPRSRVVANDFGLPVKDCTALINVPTVKVHTLAGIAVSIKNYINFTGNRSSYHFDGSAKLGETWLLPDVKGKTRLIVVDMLRPYFGPGPQINPLHQWDYKGILVGTDPVAIDTVCLSICQKKRNLFKGEEWLISPPPRSLAAADSVYHLGTSDPTKIKLTRLGWENEQLV
ncbi:MAG: DUF362 domain-containing protein [Terriglobia bacterium]|jgi:hypothetical protein